MSDLELLGICEDRSYHDFRAFPAPASDEITVIQKQCQDCRVIRSTDALGNHRYWFKTKDMWGPKW